MFNKKVPSNHSNKTRNQLKNKIVFEDPYRQYWKVKLLSSLNNWKNFYDMDYSEELGLWISRNEFTEKMEFKFKSDNEW